MLKEPENFEKWKVEDNLVRDPSTGRTDPTEVGNPGWALCNPQPSNKNWSSYAYISSNWMDVLPPTPGEPSSAGKGDQLEAPLKINSQGKQHSLPLVLRLLSPNQRNHAARCIGNENNATTNSPHLETFLLS